MTDPGVSTSFGQGQDDEENGASVAEKLACNRCRHRKVKCDKAIPCSNCVKVGTECSYASGPKVRERRQRVMVSHTYDSKLDAIARKIDQLSERMGQLSYKASHDGVPLSGDATGSASAADQNSSSSIAFGLTPSTSSIDSTPLYSTPAHDASNADISRGHYSSSKTEYEGESSLFAHAAFASRFLQNAVNNATSIHVAQEMEAIIDRLKAAVRMGNQQSNNSLDHVYPLARSIPLGSSTRHLPLPPIEKVFLCLRMAKECPQVATLWLGEFLTPTQFHDYFLKVVSPGPATEADLIIFHCGLYWLFCECSKVVTNEETKRDFDEQASTCEINLQTVLSNLRFHHPTHVDVAYAMTLASLYCLQKNRTAAAWDLITSASRTVQALGLQHTLPGTTDSSELRRQKSHLFWTIYMTEKMLSLRLGRSSTLRDQDITLPRPGVEHPSTSFLGELAPGWISMASIQGRIYDDVYSPGTLMQPPHVRVTRAKALAAELKDVMQHMRNVHDRYEAEKGRVLGPEFHEIARRSDRVSGLSMLTLIYRSILPEKPSTSAFCQECIAAARDTLLEHSRCVDLVLKEQGKAVFLEAYINWTITKSPFVPFIIMFCHVVETSDAADLDHMRVLVESLEAGPHSQAYSTCDRQRILFRALYDVAVKYVEVKARSDAGGQDEMPWSMAQHQYSGALTSTTSSSVGVGPEGMVGDSVTGPFPGQMQLHSEASVRDNFNDPTGQMHMQSSVFGDASMEMDFSGAQLWDWFSKNQSIIRMLEDDA